MRTGPYNIVVLQPRGNVHSLAFLEIARLLFESMKSLGLTCTFHVNQPIRSVTNIILGYHLLTSPGDMRSSPAIIYQLEQLSPSDARFNQRWLDLMGHAAEIWDYSPSNVRFLQQRGLTNVKHVPLGFHEALRTIKPAPEEDIDVLFYGSANERRRKIFKELKDRCRFQHLFGVYGDARDPLIARSKIILNVRLNQAQIFEQARVSYLLNNGCFVVSEDAPDNPYRGMIRAVHYEHLVDTCIDYLARPEDRRRIAQEGADQFARMPMTEILKGVLE